MFFDIGDIWASREAGMGDFAPVRNPSIRLSAGSNYMIHPIIQ